jgi:hypothetical protein
MKAIDNVRMNNDRHKVKGTDLSYAWRSGEVGMAQICDICSHMLQPIWAMWVDVSHLVWFGGHQDVHPRMFTLASSFISPSSNMYNPHWHMYWQYIRRVKEYCRNAIHSRFQNGTETFDKDDIFWPLWSVPIISTTFDRPKVGEPQKQNGCFWFLVVELEVLFRLFFLRPWETSQREVSSQVAIQLATYCLH